MRESIVIPVSSINAVLWRRPSFWRETRLRVLVSGAGEPVVVSPALYSIPGKGGRAYLEPYEDLVKALEQAIAARAGA